MTETPLDSRPEVTRRLARGMTRALRMLGFSPLSEVTLGNGRRADLMALDGAGAILLVEIKSSLEDFRVDTKWPEYLDFCDYFYFAVAPEFPQELIPDRAGLFVADAYGAEMLRDSPRYSLAPARRRTLLLDYAHLASRRLNQLLDPPPSNT